MSKVKITGHASGSGTITLTGPNTSSDRTITLPDATGTALMTDGSGVSLTALNGTQVTSGTVPAARMPAGSVIQVVNATTGSTGTSTSTTFADTSLTATITPSSSSNKILVTVHQSGLGKSEANENYARYRLLRGASVICNFEMQAGFTLTSIRNLVGGSGCSYLDSPSTTSATTYKTQYNTSGAGDTVVVQANSSISTITLMEIAV